MQSTKNVCNFWPENVRGVLSLLKSFDRKYCKIFYCKHNSYIAIGDTSIMTNNLRENEMNCRYGIECRWVGSGNFTTLIIFTDFTPLILDIDTSHQNRGRKQSHNGTEFIGNWFSP